MLQHDHVGHIGCLAVENLGGPRQAPHDLGQRREVEVAHPVPQAEVPQPRRVSFGPQAGEERRGLAAPDDMLHPVAMARQDLGIEEDPDGRAEIHLYFIWLVSSAAAPPRSLPYFRSAARPPAA